MDTNTLLMIFIAVTAVAVLIQMFILLGLFLSVKKTSTRVEALAGQVESQALPMLENARTLLNDTRPKIEATIADVNVITETVRKQLERVELTLNDIIDRTRLQVIRGDEMVTRAMDRVEETTDSVSRAAVAPIRQASAVVSGIVTGVSTYFGQRRGRERVGVPQDEMFI